ncbi:MAG: hypothetical protein LBH00_08370 [Planctomycetaceae bacterium]|nr:hypothetical protein [Planctomycetaceae bacterium]
MTVFQEKTIKFIGKSANPAANEILQGLLGNADTGFRRLAFNALYLKKEPELYVMLFRQFLTDEEFWWTACSSEAEVRKDRIGKLADAAMRESSGTLRGKAAEITMKYNLLPMLPTVIYFLESSDAAVSQSMRKVLLHLAESFYADIAAAPENERVNFDRKREWFVGLLDSPVKRYSVNQIDEVIQSLLIIAKKDFDTMKVVAADHRSATAKKIGELLRTGDHKSYLRVLLNYVNDIESPAVMDAIITERSDPLFVRKLLEFIGKDPSPEFRDALKRFQDFAWFNADNPELPALVEGLERNAVQLLSAVSFPKERVVRLYRFFFERPSVDSRRAAAESVRWLIGEEINRVLLHFVNDSDGLTAATIFRLLKTRNVAEVDKILPALIERPNQDIRQAIYEMMPDLHVESFAARVSQMTPMSAQSMGRYVRLADPNTYKMIEDNIGSPIPIRRSAACRVAFFTGYAKEFLAKIIKLAEEDDETSVRTTAINFLGMILEKQALETLLRLKTDRSMDVRETAERASNSWAAAWRAKSTTPQPPATPAAPAAASS